MERKISIQNEVIIKLKEQLKEHNEKENDEKFLKFEMDIEHLRIANDEKEVTIENISKEKENLRVELEDLKNVNMEKNKVS